jgi:hypothetical protein
MHNSFFTLRLSITPANVYGHLLNYKLKNLKEKLNITDQAEEFNILVTKTKIQLKWTLKKLSIMLQMQRSESKIIREGPAVVLVPKYRA